MVLTGYVKRVSCQALVSNIKRISYLNFSRGLTSLWTRSGPNFDLAARKHAPRFPTSRPLGLERRRALAEVSDFQPPRRRWDARIGRSSSLGPAGALKLVRSSPLGLARGLEMRRSSPSRFAGVLEWSPRACSALPGRPNLRPILGLATFFAHQESWFLS